MTNFMQRHHTLEGGREAYESLPRHTVRLVTWNTRDPNIAGVLRTAEAFRIEHVYMLRKPKTLAAAAGEGLLQPTTYSADLVSAIQAAKEDGYTVVALEQTTESVRLTDAALPEKLCLVAGDEGGGVPGKALALCDMAVEIPQYGLVPSLNVTSAISIALYEWIRQHGLTR